MINRRVSLLLRDIVNFSFWEARTREEAYLYAEKRQNEILENILRVRSRNQPRAEEKKSHRVYNGYHKNRV